MEFVLDSIQRLKRFKRRKHVRFSERDEFIIIENRDDIGHIYFSKPVDYAGIVSSIEELLICKFLISTPPS